MTSAPGYPKFCPRVCIFDIDNTVTVGTQHNPDQCKIIEGPKPAWPQQGSGTTQAVKDAIKTCYDMGYNIAFTSAESQKEGDNDKQEAFIRSLDPTGGLLFTRDFFKSPAYQNAWNIVAHTRQDAQLEFGHKEAMFLSVLKHYGIEPPCFKSSIVFDDQAENICTAHNLGLRTVQSSPECGGFYCSEGCGIPAGAISAIERLS